MPKSVWDHIVSTNAFLREEDESTKDDAPKKKSKDDGATPKKKQDDDPAPAKRVDDEDSGNGSFSDLKIERTPAAIRATAYALASIIGGTKYTPVGDTPENILDYALIHYAKGGHNPAVDAVTARALQFADFIGVGYNKDVIPDTVRVHLTGKKNGVVKEADELVHQSTFQTNPVLRQSIVRSISLWLTVTGYVDAGQKVLATNNIGWGELIRATDYILGRADQIGYGRGRKHIKEALAAYFNELGLLQSSQKNALPDAEAKDDNTTATSTTASKATTAQKTPPAPAKKDNPDIGWGLYDYRTHKRIGNATQDHVDANRDKHRIVMIAVDSDGELVPVGTKDSQRVYTKKD